MGDDKDSGDSGDSGDDGGSSSSRSSSSKKEKKKKTERKRSRSSRSGGGGGGGTGGITFPSTDGGAASGGADDGGTSDDDGGAGDDAGTADDGDGGGDSGGGDSGGGDSGGGADDGGSSDDDGGAGDDAGAADDDGGGDDTGQSDDDGGGDDGRRKLLAGHITWQCIRPGGAAPDGGRRLLAEGNVSASVMQMLEKKECNLATDLDARDVYQANKALGYQAIFAEDSKGDGEGRTLHAVAVVPASTCEANPNVTLADLKGGNACSAGYKQTSGWTIPLATMVTQGDGSNTEELGKTDWEAMTSFFPQMCSPGGPEEADEKLCANCAGDCESGDGEPYSGHAGSMRCLMEGKGDVAFTKETAPLDFAADVKLVCPNGGCADVADHDTCNFATVPTNMIAVSPDLPVDEIRSEMMEKMNSQEWSDWMASNPSLFKGGSKGLVPIQEDTVEYMGNIADVYQSLDNLGYL